MGYWTFEEGSNVPETSINGEWSSCLYKIEEGQVVAYITFGPLCEHDANNGDWEVYIGSNLFSSGNVKNPTCRVVLGLCDNTDWPNIVTRVSLGASSYFIDDTTYIFPGIYYEDKGENNYTYTIIFTDINGIETQQWTLKYDDEIICPDPGTYEGYTFSGFYFSHYNDTLYNVEDIVKVSDIVQSDTENLTLNFNIRWESIISRNVSIYTSNGWVLGDSYYWDGTSWIKCKINTL